MPVTGVNIDVISNLGLKLASYDLLLSLFAGKMIEYCEKYIKPGGIILTGSFFSDNESIKEKETFKLIGLIKRKNKKYILSHNFAKPQQSKSKLKQKNNILEYIDNECYYLYPLCGLNSECMFQPVNISVV